MLNSKPNARHLLDKYREGTCTEEERIAVEQWYEQFRSGSLEIDEHIVEGHMDQVWARLRSENNKSLLQRLWLPAKIAASIILILSVGTYFFLKYMKEEKEEPEISFSQVMPGTNKATLTLSDGRTIALEDLKSGLVAEVNGARILKAKDGYLVYTLNDKGQPINNSTPLINTIKTPNGGQYQVKLPDGSEVTLNAASSLRYPAVFTGQQRVVELSGEAYFDVAHNRAKPFIVKTATQVVQVLGTHFNINAYADEARTVTTLEEGSVKVSAGTDARNIKPGQETILSSDNVMRVRQADLDIALAWKNNKMMFKDAGIEEIMRQVARWYNIKVEYQGAIPEDTITGTISRSSDLSSVLKMFESLEIKFSLVQTSKGKKLIIKP
jgi:transmembrane sensor